MGPKISKGLTVYECIAKPSKKSTGQFWSETMTGLSVFFSLALAYFQCTKAWFLKYAKVELSEPASFLVIRTITTESFVGCASVCRWADQE